MTRISFEFFPPHDMDGAFRLSRAVAHLAPYAPDFASVTYGAGGTTRQNTHDAVQAIGKTYGLNVAAHLTCVDATREQTLQIAQDYAQAGVTQIVALRGDPAGGAANFVAHEDGFSSTVDLIRALADMGKFDIRVAAYPDVHPEAANASADLDWLKAKIDAGATSAITQFFFEAETFLRFRDQCAAAGISIPILPGILPVTNWSKIREFARRCGTRISANVEEGWARALRDGHQDLYALTQCTTLCTALLEEGVDHLHFFTLNRPERTCEVLAALGVTPVEQDLAVA